MNNYKNIILLFFLSFTFFSSAIAREESPYLYNNPLITPTIRHAIRPYLLPKKHPTYSKLNEIFQKSRPIIDDHALEQAGFTILHRKPRSFIRVVKHPKLPGYLLKVNLDSETRLKQRKPAWHWLVNRCKGAAKVKQAIKRVHSQFFDVAHKWIYVVPTNPPAPVGPGFSPQPIVLVVEDMDIHKLSVSKEAWRSRFTPRHLDELFAIVSIAGGSSYRPDNVSLRKNGKFAFIDTEYPNRSPDYNEISSQLNPFMRIYWHNLMVNYGIQ